MLFVNELEHMYDLKRKKVSFTFNLTYMFIHSYNYISISRMLSFASSLSTLITPNSTATSTMDYLARGNQETCDKSKRLLENALSLASSLSLQSCFDFRAMRENNESYKRGQKKFSSVEGGDPFTIKSAFEAWLQMCVLYNYMFTCALYCLLVYS